MANNVNICPELACSGASRARSHLGQPFGTKVDVLLVCFLTRTQKVVLLGSFAAPQVRCNGVGDLQSLLEKGLQSTALVRHLIAVAIAQGQLTCLEVLIAAVGIDARLDATGYTALHAAAFLNQAPVVEWLLLRGVDTQIRDFQGRTALELAILYRPTERDDEA